MLSPYFFSQAAQKVQSSKDTAVSPSNGDQAVPETVAEVEDKDMVKNEEPSEHVANGKGISFFGHL